VLQQRGIDRLPEEAAYLANCYGDSDHPEAAMFGRSTSLTGSSSAALLDRRAEAVWMVDAGSNSSH